MKQRWSQVSRYWLTCLHLVITRMLPQLVPPHSSIIPEPQECAQDDEERDWVNPASLSLGGLEGKSSLGVGFWYRVWPHADQILYVIRFNENQFGSFQPPAIVLDDHWNPKKKKHIFQRCSIPLINHSYVFNLFPLGMWLKSGRCGISHVLTLHVSLNVC